MLLMHGKTYDTLASTVRASPSYLMLLETGIFVMRRDLSDIVHIREVHCLMYEKFRNSRCDFILYSALPFHSIGFMLLKPEFTFKHLLPDFYVQVPISKIFEIF